MTVAELIAKLQEMPQDMVVAHRGDRDGDQDIDNCWVHYQGAFKVVFLL